MAKSQLNECNSALQRSSSWANERVPLRQKDEDKNMLGIKNVFRESFFAALIAIASLGTTATFLHAQSRSEFAPLPGALTPEERAAKAAETLRATTAPVVTPSVASPAEPAPVAPTPAAVTEPAAPVPPAPPVVSAPAEPKPVSTGTEEPTEKAGLAPPAVESPPSASIPVVLPATPEKSVSDKHKEKAKASEKTARKDPEEKSEKANLRYEAKLPPDDKGPRAIDFLGACASNYDKCQQFLREQVKKIPDGDVCFSDSTDQVEVTEKVRKYITLRPAIHHLAANRMVAEALYVMYPCKRAAPRSAEKRSKKQK